MLYKKIHRQYLRMWRIGREFKFEGKVYKITAKPYIEENYISIDCLGEYSSYRLIQFSSGHVWKENDSEEWIEWLD